MKHKYLQLEQWLKNNYVDVVKTYRKTENKQKTAEIHNTSTYRVNVALFIARMENEVNPSYLIDFSKEGGLYYSMRERINPTHIKVKNRDKNRNNNNINNNTDKATMIITISVLVID